MLYAAAPTMIIGRIMAGDSRPNDSWTRSSLPHRRATISGALRFTSLRSSQTIGTVDIDSESGSPIRSDERCSGTGASQVEKHVMRKQVDVEKGVD